MTALGRRRGRTPQRGPKLSEGTKHPGEPVLFVPSPSPGWDLAVRVRASASAPCQANLEGRSAVSCRAPGLWRSADCAASSIDPDPVPPYVRRRTAGNWSLDPARRTLRSEDRPVTSGRRAGPVRLISGVSPGFPRRRVPWPVDVPTKPAMRQAPELAPMCTTGSAAVDKPVNVCGRIEFASADQRFALSTETDASGAAPRARTGGELRGPQAGGRTTSLVYPPGAIRHTVFDTSSAISRMRLAGSKATPTGRPRALPSFRKPVAKSTGCPDGRPLANGMKTTL